MADETVTGRRGGGAGSDRLAVVQSAQSLGLCSAPGSAADRARDYVPCVHLWHVASAGCAVAGYRPLNACAAGDVA
ncbi:MAG: hypothetical protein K9K37_02660 [Desulfocapsa sp.]|nr:hypothetical protein [Desulfocapsa sp.]